MSRKIQTETFSSYPESNWELRQAWPKRQWELFAAQEVRGYAHSLYDDFEITITLGVDGLGIGVVRLGDGVMFAISHEKLQEFLNKPRVTSEMAEAALTEEPDGGNV